MQTFFTVKEIATGLQMNPLTIYEYIRKGTLPAVKFGRYYRVSEEDFEHFISMLKVTKEARFRI